MFVSKRRELRLGGAIASFESVQAKDGEKCFVYSPKLLVGEMAGEFPESSGVYRPDLFDQDLGGLTGDLRFGTE